MAAKFATGNAFSDDNAGKGCEKKPESPIADFLRSEFAKLSQAAHADMEHQLANQKAEYEDKMKQQEQKTMNEIIRLREQLEKDMAEEDGGAKPQGVADGGGRATETEEQSAEQSPIAEFLRNEFARLSASAAKELAQKLAEQKTEYEEQLKEQERELREEMESETIRLREDLEQHLAEAADGATRAREVISVSHLVNSLTFL